MDLSECVVNMSLADTEVNLETAQTLKINPKNNHFACGVVINGVHTDIVLKVYRNRIFLVVSQFKKLGSMITVSREAALNTFNSSVYSIKTLLGKDDTETHLAGRFIAEQIDIDKPLLLSVCLKDYGVETLRAVVAAINQIKPW